jgi:phosphatidylinositol alpha-1,6-mannosyltransferase
MYIFFLTTDFPPLTGGIQHYLYQIVLHLPYERVCVIAPKEPGWKAFDADQPFSIRRFDLPIIRSPVCSPQINTLTPAYYCFPKLSQVQENDIILCGSAQPALMFMAWLMWRVKGIPYGIFTYGLDLLFPQTRVYRRIFNWLLGASHVVFSDSHAAAGIARRCGVKPERITVVHPTVTLAKLGSTTSPVEVRRRHSLDGKKCILTVGRLVERKGHDQVIRALPDILTALPTAHYLIVGQGPFENNLKALVSELSLEKHVTFAGYVPDEELAAYYRACDVFAMISREIPERGDIEGFGIVYLEANLMGKPVVAGHSGGVPDAVLHEKTGLLVNPNDSTEVASAIIRLLKEPELAQQFGETGRVRALNDFSGSAAAQKVLTALSNLSE